MSPRAAASHCLDQRERASHMDAHMHGYMDAHKTQERLPRPPCLGDRARAHTHYYWVVAMHPSSSSPWSRNSHGVASGALGQAHAANGGNDTTQPASMTQRGSGARLAVTPSSL